MKARNRGTIITMSSFAGQRPHAQSPVAYAAAKAGIEMLTRDLALQAGPHGMVATFLASKEAAWLTGVIVDVTGGA
jgi:3-oxoacyl-[acyl-carrier protein] reductase